MNAVGYVVYYKLSVNMFKSVGLILLLLQHLICGYTAQKLDPKQLRCLVCQAVVEEMDTYVQKIDPNRQVAIGGYGLDSEGNLRGKKVKYARSELHMSEVMDDVCKKIEDYVRAWDKKTGKLRLLKLITSDGSMNTEIGNVDIIQDSDLNESLEFYCLGIVEEFEDSILKLYAAEADNVSHRLCSDDAQLCEAPVDDDLEEEGGRHSDESESGEMRDEL